MGLYQNYSRWNMRTYVAFCTILLMILYAGVPASAQKAATGQQDAGIAAVPLATATPTGVRNTAANAPQENNAADASAADASIADASAAQQTPAKEASTGARNESSSARKPTTLQQDGYLLLVNLEHAYEKEPQNLVRLDTVIEKGLVAMKNSHLVEKTTGLAANEMFRAAKEEGIGKLVIDSVYRSVARQEAMWQKRVRRDADYGKDPYTNPVKVLPGGMSEHATGLAMDIFAKSYQKANAAFGETEEGKWLAQHAHRFGFILRYPADKQHITGVVYEPWHFRYVGVNAATEMYNKNLCLEEYLKKA